MRQRYVAHRHADNHTLAPFFPIHHSKKQASPIRAHRTQICDREGRRGEERGGIEVRGGEARRGEGRGRA